MFAILKKTSSRVVREFGRQTHSITTEAHPISRVSGKLRSVKPIRTKMKLNDIFPAIAGAATFMIDAAQAKKKNAENRTGSARRQCAKFIVNTHNPSTSKAVTYNLALVGHR